MSISTLRKLTFGAAGLAVLALIFHATAGEAIAQIRPAYTKNVDEPGRMPYQNTVNISGITFGNCSNVLCAVAFPTVPTGKRLVVEHVSVNMICSGSIDDFKMKSLTLARSDNTGSRLDIAPTGVAPDVRNIIIDKRIRFYFEPGLTPLLLVPFQGCDFIGGGNGTLVGYLIDATN